MIVPQPLTRKSPLIQPVLKALNDQGFPAEYDMQQHQLLKCLHPLVLDHVAGYPNHILKVRRLLHQCVQIEVGGDGLKGRTGALRRHPEREVSSRVRAPARR